MKCLKFGFLSLVSLSTISFVLIAHANVIKNKIATQIENCFIPVISIEYDHNCSFPIDGVLTSTTSCQAGQGSVGAHVFTVISDNDKISDENVAEECGGDQVVCCVFLEVDPAPCTGQPTYPLNGSPAARYRISGITCKPLAE